MREVSFDARAASLAIPHPDSDPLFSADGSSVCQDTTTTSAVLTLAAATATTAANSRLQLRAVQHCNERRRIFEDNLAAVCMGFVLVFLVCHFPR